MSEVLNFKLLGVTFDRGLPFRDHIRNLSLRGSRRLGFLQNVSKLLVPKLRTAVFSGFVRPTLKYAVVVWIGASSSVFSRLSSLQRRALHKIESRCYIKSLEVCCTVSALCHLYKLHDHSLPGPVQILLSAAKAPLY